MSGWQIFDAAAAAGRIVTIDEKCLDDFVQAVYDQRVGDGAASTRSSSSTPR